MSYAPVNDGIPRLPQEHGIHEMKSFSDSRASLEEMSPMDGKEFEQYTGYESTTHLYTPPPGPSHGQEGGKNRGQLAPAKIWSMNKLRSFILAFDIVFHATPLMFIGISWRIHIVFYKANLILSTFSHCSEAGRETRFGVWETSATSPVAFADNISRPVRGTDGSLLQEHGFVPCRTWHYPWSS